MDQTTVQAPPLMELNGVEVEYLDAAQRRVRLLDGISLSVRADEMVAILGPSGSGKSSLVRVMAGLTAPSAGTVELRGQALRGSSPRVGVVFQTPALFPWMTVQGNVELGLERMPVSRAQKDSMIAWAVDRLGLEGFEEAYPRELGHGMKLRVALARALAPQPELLILDNPFAGLDVLSAESLRNELVSLWQHSDVNPKAIVLVTHDIEEAVALSTRVLVLSGSPGRLAVELPVPLPYPRDPGAAAFRDTVGRLHDFLTKQILPDDAPSVGRIASRLLPLPKVELGQILGLLEALDDRGGHLDVFDFAAETRREYQGMVAVVNAAELLGLVATPKDQVELTEKGRLLQRSDVNGRKALLNIEFQRIPLFAHFVEMIQRSGEHAIRREVALEQLALLFPSENPVQLFHTLVAWTRYAELFGFSARRSLLYLDRTFVQEAGELREVQRPKPGPKPRAVKAPQAAAPSRATAPLPAAVPEPEALSEDALHAAEELTHHEPGGLAEAVHAAHAAQAARAGADGLDEHQEE
jgi:NitT/TauT family transport system ATP-binding protein